MINKERLETLIKEGATIYSTRWKEEVDLSQKCEVVKKSFYDGKERLVLIVHEDEEHSPHYMLENLTEDIEGAKWEEEFGCIERTERLELPTWEENKPIECVFSTPYRSSYCLKTRVKTGYSIEKENPYIIRIFKFGESDNFIDFEFTKENYTLACRKCKELFLGEENNV